MMIVSAMYTANLAAFLTVNRLHVGLRRVEDLLDQDEYTWGTVFSTNPEILMSNSIKENHRKIIDRALDVGSAEVGYNKAHDSKFAFIYESPYLEYKQQLACDNLTSLIKVGEEFSKFGLAFGIQRNAPFAEVMNLKLLHYREIGWLEELWTMWLREGRPCNDAMHGHDDLGSSEELRQRGSTLDMSYMSGLFITLGVMCFTTVLIVTIELLYASLLDAYGGQPVYNAGIVSSRDGKPGNTADRLKFWAAVGRRLHLLKYDFLTHWWTVDSFKSYRTSSTEEKEKTCLEARCGHVGSTGHVTTRDSNPLCKLWDPDKKEECEQPYCSDH